ncbi:hypothetical protein PMIN04_012102 [Paraphaeosphaeria minitans]
MPPRNAPLPNAVNLFNCAICDKGYPRQTDYENHLRSYDHNHRQRLADMKKLTDASASDAPRPKVSLDMRNLSHQGGDAAKKGLGPRFSKVGGAAATATGGSRFRKIGEVKEVNQNMEEEEEEEVKTEQLPKDEQADPTKEPVDVADVISKAQVELAKDEDVVMADDAEDDAEDNAEDDAEDNAVTWDEYDVTKPSDCDHASCLGCAAPVDPVYENGWLVMGSA